MTGHDRQWDLNRLNFEGRWCGTSRWYERAGDGLLDLSSPVAVIEDTCYAISFSDPDSGLWDGSGLRFAPDGRRRLPLSRASYNGGGQCWQFRGAAGQSSLVLDSRHPRFGHEVNLFRGRSRSMLVLLYAPAPALGWRLQSLGVVPFRCSLAAEPDPARPAASDWRALLAEQEGWPCWRSRRAGLVSWSAWSPSAGLPLIQSRSRVPPSAAASLVTGSAPIPVPASAPVLPMA
uniref:hypothetical protein n=1 Tax=Synechococcus sp. CS-1329 TaxID=2847975 RepID=UPI00223B68F4|nr:hypothetical protein [Synechococcus sp. CS-1329]